MSVGTTGDVGIGGGGVLVAGSDVTVGVTTGTIACDWLAGRNRHSYTPSDHQKKHKRGYVLTVEHTSNYTRACRGVAQLVAHRVWDAGVGGSSPPTPTKGIN